MQISDAASILRINGNITPQKVKKAFHEAAKKYHPDVNSAGEEMMKVVNSAFEVLKDYEGIIEAKQGDDLYPEALNTALMAIISIIGIKIEICGAWVWVTGDTFKYKTTLKENGFKYASKKKAWHFRPENWKSRSRGKSSMEEIRAKYGSANPKANYRNRLSQ